MAGVMGLACVAMTDRGDLAQLAVASLGSLVTTGDVWEPYQLVDPGGAVVSSAGLFLRDLQASGRATSTQRSYAMALLRWFRFLWAADLAWDQVTRAEARDFCRWLQFTTKPSQPGSRGGQRAGSGTPGRPNPVTGKPSAGRGYSVATAAHSESVLRGFYEFHRDAGSGPMVNPFPLVRGRGVRAHAHRNPMEPRRDERAGLYRPKLAVRLPRRIPDEYFSALFAGLPSNRDRALVAFWVSTGARASELLGASRGDADAGQQLITVIRKGSRMLQQLPASPDAFVWLRLYQAETDEFVPAGRDEPLWWTLRRPFRPLAYHAAYRMFARVNAALGANWSPHDLRHTAAYRMARDPGMPLSDVQWVLGHARLTTTQIYQNPVPEDVIASVVAYHARRARAAHDLGPGPAAAAAQYRPESLRVLFGEGK
jgi:integrase